MKYIKIIKPYQNQSYKAGQIVKISDAVADQLIAKEAAEEIKISPVELKKSKLPEDMPHRRDLAALGFDDIKAVKGYKSNARGGKSLLHTIPGVGNQGEVDIIVFIGKYEIEATKEEKSKKAK